MNAFDLKTPAAPCFKLIFPERHSKTFCLCIVHNSLSKILMISIMLVCSTTVAANVYITIFNLRCMAFKIFRKIYCSCTSEKARDQNFLQGAEASKEKVRNNFLEINVLEHSQYNYIFFSACCYYALKAAVTVQ